MNINIALLCTVIGVVTGSLTFILGRISVAKQKAKEEAIISVKLDNIYAIVSELKDDTKDIKNKVATHDGQIIKLFEEVKSLKHRMDNKERNNK